MPYDPAYMKKFFYKHFVVGDVDDCWEWTGDRNADNYGMWQRKRAHRVAWEVANGKSIPPGMFVMHNCDNPPCVNHAHLRIGTNLDNVRDMISRGRRSDHLPPFISVLTPAQVVEIRRARISGLGVVELGKKYGITHSHISKICRGDCWRTTGDASDIRAPRQYNRKDNYENRT